MTSSIRVSKNIRILAIDDSPREGSISYLIGIIWRNGIVEGVLSTKVEYDGRDSTERIIEMINRSRFSKQINLILINSITVAGLNIVDIKQLSHSLSIPVIAVTRHHPRVEELERAVRELEGSEAQEEKLRAIREAGEPFRIKTRPELYAQVAGMDRFRASELIKSVGIEPLRIAHLVSSALVLGESKGRF